MSTTISRKAFFTVFIVFYLLISSVSHGVGEDSVQSKIVLTTDIASSENQVKFTPYDTIYAVVTLSGVAAGKYTADISWANASGTMNRYSPVSLTIAPKTPFTFYSWLRLMKTGPLKSTFTGENFTADSLGKWILTVSVEGVFLKTVEFEID